MKNIYCFFVLLSFLLSNSVGQNPSFDQWPTYSQLLSNIAYYETNYPNLCTVIEVGTTVNGKKIQCLKLTNKNITGTKPRVLLCGPIHGNELTGFMLSFRLYDLLTSEYNSNPRIQSILDSVEIYSIPLVNIDGAYYGDGNTITDPQRRNANDEDINRSFPGGPNVDVSVEDQTKETKALLSFFESLDYNFTIGAVCHDNVPRADEPMDGGSLCHIPWIGTYTHHHENSWYQNAFSRFRSASDGFVFDFGCNITPYLLKGSLLDYGAYHLKGMKSYSFELTDQQPIQETDFDFHWYEFKNTLLTFIELAISGIQGVVRDSITGDPIANVKVFVEDYDQDSSWVYTYPTGAYYKPILTGNYNITFLHSNF